MKLIKQRSFVAFMIITVIIISPLLLGGGGRPLITFVNINTVLASPIPPGPCAGLTGDAFTRCVHGRVTALPPDYPFPNIKDPSDLEKAKAAQKAYNDMLEEIVSLEQDLVHLDVDPWFAAKYQLEWEEAHSHLSPSPPFIDIEGGKWVLSPATDNELIRAEFNGLLSEAVKEQGEKAIDTLRAYGSAEAAAELGKSNPIVATLNLVTGLYKLLQNDKNNRIASDKSPEGLIKAEKIAKDLVADEIAEKRDKELTKNGNIDVIGHRKAAIKDNLIIDLDKWKKAFEKYRDYILLDKKSSSRGKATMSVCPEGAKVEALNKAQSPLHCISVSDCYDGVSKHNAAEATRVLDHNAAEATRVLDHNAAEATRVLDHNAAEADKALAQFGRYTPHYETYHFETAHYETAHYLSSSQMCFPGSQVPVFSQK